MITTYNLGRKNGTVTGNAVFGSGVSPISNHAARDLNYQMGKSLSTMGTGCIRMHEVEKARKA